MTDLQKTEFEMLRVFVSICEQLKLPYYLVCGSALGAVKYGGFIPWDDDVDVAMPRAAYEAFMRQASALLPKEYFLQYSGSETRFPFIYCKLRNSNTTFIEKNSAHLPIHHGVYIDIFPLDGYPVSADAQQRLERRKRLYTLQTYSDLNVPRSWKVKLLNRLLRIMGCHLRTGKIVRKYTKLISSYDIETSELVCNHGNWQGHLEYAPKEHYGAGVLMTFEGLTVRVPEQYDAYLTQKYGDWRSDPPKEQQVGHHYYEICDLNRPYTDYV